MFAMMNCMTIFVALLCISYAVALLPTRCVAPIDGTVGRRNECRIVDSSTIWGYCDGTHCRIPERCKDNYGCKDGVCGFEGDMNGHAITRW